MIKLTRPDEPETLKKEKLDWTAALMRAVNNHGSYDRIPEGERDKLIAYYKMPELKNALASSSYNKCAYCECIPAEGGDVEVEHFAPKSAYPELTFEWTNLLPSCKICNRYKGSHDTQYEPIVNPYLSNPVNFFYFSDIALKAKPGDNNEVANRTIEVCRLNSKRLLNPRASILIALREFAFEINDAITRYLDADTPRKKTTRLRDIRQAIEKIEGLKHPKEKYSSFCKSFLDNCDEYQKAVDLLGNIEEKS